MQLVSGNKTRYIVRLDPGEELLERIHAFCEEQGIEGAWVSALGSSQEVELAFYRLQVQEYETTVCDEHTEIITIAGNVSLHGGDLSVHLHGTFGRRDMSVIGGHIMRCVVSATAEVCIDVSEETMERQLDEETGLNTLHKNDDV